MDTRYFKIVGIRPGPVINPDHGEIDLRDLSDQKALQLYREGFPYVKLTKAGERKFNMDVDESDENYAQPVPEAPVHSEPAEFQPEPQEPEYKLHAYQVVDLIQEAETIDEAEQRAEGYKNYKSVQDALDSKRRQLEE